jgi:signal transduction histidine kinase
LPDELAAHLGGTVLLVDDDEGNLAVMQSFLSAELTVLTASSGAEALGLLARPDIDVVLTDQRMPGMTGVELLAKARAMRPDLAGVLVTAFVDTPALIAAINQAHAFAFLRKPWQPAELLQAVSAARIQVAQQRRIGALVHDLQRRGEHLQRTVDELQTARSQLFDAERLAVTGRMAAGIAHDLRNAMSGLVLVEMESVARGIDADLLDTIRVGLSVMRNLLGQLDTLGSYTRQRRLSMALDRFDPAMVIHNALAVLRLDLGLRQRQLLVQAEQGTLPQVWGDQAKLVQAMVNLIRNAVQATEPGQQIVVSATASTALAGERPGVVLQVEDAGRGIDPVIQAQLFEAFASTKGDQGLGLGLYMTRLVAEHHNGTLVALPREPQGTIFALHLPPAP